MADALNSWDERPDLTVAWDLGPKSRVGYEEPVTGERAPPTMVGYAKTEIAPGVDQKAQKMFRLAVKPFEGERQGSRVVLQKNGGQSAMLTIPGADRSMPPLKPRTMPLSKVGQVLQDMQDGGISIYEPTDFEMHFVTPSKLNAMSFVSTLQHNEFKARIDEGNPLCLYVELRVLPYPILAKAYEMIAEGNGFGAHMMSIRRL